MRVPRPRIHVLGLGSIGTFTAHGLKEAPAAPAITLLLHRESLYNDLLRNNRQITLRTLEGKTVSHSGYDVEIHKSGRWQAPSSTAASDKIDSLVVTVKATQTVTALRALTSRLTPSSTILFLQNGCGMIEEVNENLFPDPLTRPNYVVGVISHGVTLTSPFNATHTGAASISLGLVPRASARKDNAADVEAKARYMLDTFPLSARLSASSYAYTDVLQVQFEKLAVNAFCNPVCALHDAKNAILFTFPDLRRAILSEISTIVLNLPELRGVQGLEERFSVARLEHTVNGILERTRETTCSMVVDLRNKRKTEVNFINGYWVRRGRELGVSVAVHESLMAQVLERSAT
ncbi:ketopantoate reductase PanE/ApbA-domain-containing protein [Aspergillus recurvatus]